MESASHVSPLALWGYWPAHKRRTLGVHKNDGLEIVLVLRGEVTWQVEGVAETVSPGSLFFTLPWEAHGSVRHHEPGCELYFAVLRLDRHYSTPSRHFRFHKGLALGREMTQRVRRAMLQAPRRACPATRQLAIILPQLVEEMSRADAAPEAGSALARLALIELYRSLTGEGRGRVNQRGGRRPGAKERVSQFVRNLPAACARAWTLDNMARACDLGRSRFSALLRELTGDTPIMALNRARVDLAKRRLRESGEPITTVASECGFESSQYFASVFRAYVG